MEDWRKTVRWWHTLRLYRVMALLSLERRLA